MRPRPLPSPLPSPLFLLLLLTQAERSWAYAQQLAGERSEEAPRKRFHQLKRLKRAVEQSRALEAACAQHADARTQLQAEAYCADLAGAYAFERGDFSGALGRFLHARSVYAQLGRVGGSDIAALCDERRAAQSDQIRMSRYFRKQQREAQGAGNHGGETEEDDDDDGSALPLSSSSSVLSSRLQLLLKEREERAAQSLDTVTWLGRAVPVSNEKARLVLARVQRMRHEAEGGAAAAAAATAADGDAEVDVDGQRSVTGLYQQMANAYDDLGRIAKEDLVDVVASAHHTPHSDCAPPAGSAALTSERRSHPPVPPPPSCAVSRSWTRTARISRSCSSTRRSSQPQPLRSLADRPSP